MRTIKRYSNRKLYDMDSKRYVTLENIEVLIRDGEELQIIDNDSGEDITAGTLSQIIAEQTKKNHAYAPSIFVDLIRKGSGTMYMAARKMLQAVGDTASSMEEGLEKTMKGLAINPPDEPKKTEQERKPEPAVTAATEDSQWQTVIHLILGKLSIPTQTDVLKLQESLARLENCVNSLETQLAQKRSAPPQEQQKSKE